MTTLSDGAATPSPAAHPDMADAAGSTEIADDTGGTFQWRVLVAMAVTLVLWASAFVAIRRRPTWPRRGDW